MKHYLLILLSLFTSAVLHSQIENFNPGIMPEPTKGELENSISSEEIELSFLFNSSTTLSDRVSLAVSKHQNGTSRRIPHQKLVELCGDLDGCTVRLERKNCNIAVHLFSEDFLLYYNKINNIWSRRFRFSGTDPDGRRDDIYKIGNCHLTDTEFEGWKEIGDSQKGIELPA